ncbi:hypothetical protein [Tenacibaculum amylolyticum]|uniref:hypothetical protein n=1 Tax=Tenacibaculum amylolyticum TaxID=104269 RepID=UPI00389331F8
MSFKGKNILLLAGVILSLPIIYWLSIKKTVALKAEYEVLEEDKKEIENISSTISYLEQENRYIDSIFKKENVSVNNSFQQIILKKINAYKETNAIEILEFKNPIEVVENQIRVELYPITIKGDFNVLLKFLSFFEQEGLGEIKTYTFEKKKEIARRKEYLVLQLYLKKILT